MPAATQSGCQEHCDTATAQFLLVVLVLVAAPELWYCAIRIESAYLLPMTNCKSTTPCAILSHGFRCD